MIACGCIFILPYLKPVSLPRFLYGGLICTGLPASAKSESLEISRSSWTWMDPPLSWFGLNKKRDECLQLDGGKTVNEKFRCRGLSLVFRGTAEMFWPANMLVWNKRRAWIVDLLCKIPEPAELDFWNTMHWSICTTVVCCRFLVFPSILSKWGFLDLKLPSGEIYTQRQGNRGPSPSIWTVEVFNRDRPPCWRTCNLILGNVIVFSAWKFQY